MPLYRMPAIVVRTHPFQDAHLIVTLYSPIKGKVRAIAKGCRRLQSALGRLVQPMVEAVFLLAEGKNLDVITQGEIKTIYPQIRSDLNKLSHGLYILELLDRFVEEPEPYPKLYFLLQKTLEALNNGEPPPILVRGYEANFLRLLGYAPRLDACVLCGLASNLYFFSSRLGGVLCAKCQEKDKQAIPLSQGLLDALKLCFAAKPGESLPISPEWVKPIGKIFYNFMTEKCGRELHGFHFLEEVDLLL
jgi:DNA repair protein RecO (recombination protein O)